MIVYTCYRALIRFPGCAYINVALLADIFHIQEEVLSLMVRVSRARTICAHSRLQSTIAQQDQIDSMLL